MKIALDVNIPCGSAAGIDVWTQGLIEGISSVDSENEYLIFSFFIRNFKQRKGTVFIPDKKNFHLYIRRIPRPAVIFLEDHNLPVIEFLLRKQGVDIFFGTSYFVPCLRKIKGIVTIHGLDFAEMDTPWYSDRWYKNVGIYLKRASMIISVSEYVKKSIVKYYRIPEEKIKVVYPGIRKNFRVLKKDEYDIPNDFKTFMPFILTVATSVERKNLKRLIQSFAMLKTGFRDLKLVIVGDLSLKEKLSDDIAKSGLDISIHFTGYLDADRLVYLYNMAELFVFPSLYEGFGLPVLEAMACGCPVITSNVSALPEVSGGAAVLVDPYNTEEIKDSMEKLLTDTEMRNDIRTKGLKHAEKFSWEKSALQIIHLYRMLRDNL